MLAQGKSMGPAAEPLGAPGPANWSSCFDWVKTYAYTHTYIMVIIYTYLKRKSQEGFPWGTPRCTFLLYGGAVVGDHSPPLIENRECIVGINDPPPTDLRSRGGGSPCGDLNSCQRGMLGSRRLNAYLLGVERSLGFVFLLAGGW